MNSKFISKRIIESIIIILCIITINFMLVRFMPGDPVLHIIGEENYMRMEVEKPEAIEKVRHDYGLDQPVYVQYIKYLGKTIQLDFGYSYRTKAPVINTLLQRMRWTLILSVPSVIISALLGGWLGLQAGWKPGKALDMVVSPVMLILSTIPSNCLAILMLFVLAFKMALFPIAGMTSGNLEGSAKTLDIIWHMTLPMISLIILRMPSYYMLMKSNISSIYREEYITVARSKGFTPRQVLRRHVLKNALSPLITEGFMQFGRILAGSMMVEIIFSWLGMGTLIYDSVNGKDFPMLQTCFLFIGGCVVACNLLADIVNMIIDPRVRENVTSGWD